MYAMATYERGDKGQKVKALQAQLKHLGWYSGNVDGKFGPATEKAVQAFQKAAGLRIDGRVGSKTWTALFPPVAAFEPVVETATASSTNPPLTFNRTECLDEKDYIPNETKKDLIVLHHTVGGTAQSTIHYWRTDPQRIGTAYVVERNGEVYETFDPKYWAYHLGLKGSGGTVDKRSIGIEIASEGGLTLRDGKLYCFDRVSNRTLFASEHYECGMPWRGYRFFDAYSEAQIASVIALTKWLCERFDITRNAPANHLDANDEYWYFRGILGHHHLRPDKSDVHPGFPWQKLIENCCLSLI
jgi:N-acetyl-anhydromuramyl-L-alanine amidase AmpD